VRLSFKAAAVVAFLVASGSAFGQGAVQQSGPVSSGHVTCWGYNGIVVDCGIPNTIKFYTIATMPLCNSSTAGLLIAVTDASSPTYNGPLLGGGNITVPIFCNGTSWSTH
jgi:hypothetical protein